MNLLRKFHICFLLISILVTFSIVSGKSQTVVSGSDKLVSNQLLISIGLEPELVATAGYTHLIGRIEKNADYHVGVSLKFAPLIISTGAWRLNLINAANWRISQNWKSQFSTKLYLAHTDNRAGKMHGLGGELRAITMRYKDVWAKGIDLGWQYTALTHIKHSEETRDTFNDRYPGGEIGIYGPRDGWYKATASRFRLGFVGSRKLGEQWILQLKSGALLSIQKQGILLGFSHAQVPVYLESTISYRY
jgi:hypothetical protein